MKAGTIIASQSAFALQPAAALVVMEASPARGSTEWFGVPAVERRQL